VASANLTPDPSGIPYYDVALFTEVLRTGHAKARRINQIMPWHAFGGMTDEDIAAIFTNLTTLKPVMHRVTNDEMCADLLQTVPSSARLRGSKLMSISRVSPSIHQRRV
jgi:hypothetical protein